MGKDKDGNEIEENKEGQEGDGKEKNLQGVSGGDGEGKEKPETYEVTVDGKQEHFTLEELKTFAGKVKGAEIKFEEASKMRKSDGKGARTIELAKKLRDSETPNADDLTEFFGNLGFEAKNIPGFEKLVSGKDIMDGQEQEGKEKGTETPVKVGMDNLDPEMKAIMQDAQQAQLETLRKNIHEKTKKGIDNDEILGKMVIEMPEDKREGVKKVLYNMAITDVTNRIVARQEKFGPEMVKAVALSTRSTIRNLGIPAKAAGHPPVVGPGQTMESNPAIYSDKPIERVNSEDPKWEENTVIRYLQKQRQGGVARKS